MLSGQGGELIAGLRGLQRADGVLALRDKAADGARIRLVVFECSG